MKRNKKQGDTISNWRIHKLSFTQEAIDKSFPNENLKPMVLSGVVVKDLTSRWVVGNTMRSSLILKYDKENGVVETRNTIYKLEGEEGTFDTAFPEMGDDILNIFW